MELKDFIKESIIECVEAVVEVQRDTRIHKLGGIVAPAWSQKSGANYHVSEKSDLRDIEFEIAVTVSNKDNGGFGINVFNAVSGNLNKENSNASVSRVKLSIPVLFPTYQLPESD